MAKQLVVTPLIGDYNTPIPTKLKENKTWSYSFKYFKQIKYFGLDRSDSKWFVSLIDRFKDLSNKDRTEVFSDKNTKNFYRYHKINWEANSIPIKKNDLNWIDSNYLSNEDEFPFYQFTISKANGRVVGFWNETHTIFYVVLLDPLHNIQPSKTFDYAVDDCYPLSCEYSSMHCDIHTITDIPSNCDNCNIKNEVFKIPIRLNQTNAIVGFLDDDFLEEYNNISQNYSLSEILMKGVFSILDENPTSN